MLSIPNAESATVQLRSSRISRAHSEERAVLAVNWLAGKVNLVPSIGLAERIFQGPASRIRRRAVANGHSLNRKRQAKSLAEIWRAATRAERVAFLRACGAELWTA
jgi:hypothetical protein